MTLQGGSMGVRVTSIFIFAPKRLNWPFRFSRQKRLVGWFHARPRNFYSKFPAKTAQMAFSVFALKASFPKLKHQNYPLSFAHFLAPVSFLMDFQSSLYL